MIKPRMIVTGATGKTGSIVVAELLKAGYPFVRWCTERILAAHS